MTNQLEVSNLISPVITGFKALGAEWKNLFDIGLYEYIDSQTSKYYFTNTFIHRGDKVRFKDIYFPVSVNYKLLNTKFNDIEELFQEYRNITIIGSAGSGKTTLIKHIFLQTIKENKKIPILIELRNLNDYENNFESMILEKVLKTKLKPNENIFKRALESGKFLFLFDGYDEIFSNKKQEINRQIELFIDTYSENYFLITTRPGGGIESFSRFYDFKICDLNDADVVSFIDIIVETEERKETIKQIVIDRKNSNYIEFLRNPLLLSMFIMAFENHPEIPNRKSAFYRNVFDTLYSKHDGITKNSFPREKRTKLQRDDFEEILSIFSYLTLLDGQYSFTNEYLTDALNKVKRLTKYDFITEDLIYDLRTSISILILDGFEYYFPHRSMQEYFTALFICKLPTNKKQKAYSNLSSTLEESSADFSFTFWSLCFELDENAFVSNFLIPQLKIIYNIVKGRKKRELQNAFFDLLEPAFLMFHVDKNEESVYKIYRTGNFKCSIMEFCEIEGYNDIWNFPKNSGRYEELEKAIIKESNSESESSNSDAQKDGIVADILAKDDFFCILEKFRSNIYHKIQQWDNEVKIKKNNIDDLLGL